MWGEGDLIRRDDIDELDVLGASDDALEVTVFLDVWLCLAKTIKQGVLHFHILVDGDEEGFHLVVVDHGRHLDLGQRVDRFQMGDDVIHQDLGEAVSQDLEAVGFQVQAVEQTLDVVCPVDGSSDVVVDGIVQDLVGRLILDEDTLRNSGDQGQIDSHIGGGGGNSIGGGLHVHTSVGWVKVKTSSRGLLRHTHNDDISLRFV